MTVAAAQNPAMQGVLEEGLTACLGRRVQILALARQPLAMQSTYPIERLHVRLTSGEEMPIIFKRLHDAAEPKGNRREVLIYRRLLAGRRFGAPLLYASAYNEAHEQYWLFLEDLGEETVADGDLEDWRAAVRWLAELHGTYQGREDELRALDCLGEQGRDYYRLLAGQARRYLGLAGNDQARARFDALRPRLEATVAHLVRLPRTLVHGDVFSDNLILQPGPRIRPIDWEGAAVGLGALDVARLLEGWGSDQPALIAAYLEEFARHAPGPLDAGQFQRTFALCELVAALWHLAWSVEGCRDAQYVDGLLGHMETIGERLSRENGNV